VVGPWISSTDNRSEPDILGRIEELQMLGDPATAATVCGSFLGTEPRKGTTTVTNTSTGEPSGAQKQFGDVAPELVSLTDDVLFGRVWERTELSPKERSLITVASLLTSGSTEQLGFHLGRARDNGATETELVEAITHLAFYAGWPKAMSAMAVAKQIFQE
jgi:4-carboxymuconolactone decarboxylase